MSWMNEGINGEMNMWLSEYMNIIFKWKFERSLDIFAKKIEPLNSRILIGSHWIFLASGEKSSDKYFWKITVAVENEWKGR